MVNNMYVPFFSINLAVIKNGIYLLWVDPSRIKSQISSN